MKICASHLVDSEELTSTTLGQQGAVGVILFSITLLTLPSALVLCSAVGQAAGAGQRL